MNPDEASEVSMKLAINELIWTNGRADLTLHEAEKIATEAHLILCRCLPKPSPIDDQEAPDA